MEWHIILLKPVIINIFFMHFARLTNFHSYRFSSKISYSQEHLTYWCIDANSGPQSKVIFRSCNGLINYYQRTTFELNETHDDDLLLSHAKTNRHQTMNCIMTYNKRWYDSYTNQIIIRSYKSTDEVDTVNFLMIRRNSFLNHQKRSGRGKPHLKYRADDSDKNVLHHHMRGTKYLLLNETTTENVKVECFFLQTDVKLVTKFVVTHSYSLFFHRYLMWTTSQHVLFLFISEVNLFDLWWMKQRRKSFSLCNNSLTLL